ncbi:MAG TPA: sigma-70 family RNA polymerase sigma factor [Candidatus Angelobacter sp.]
MSLLERFATGDLDAFETLFRQFQGRVYGWIVRIVRDPGIAEDLTVETFWRIYRARSRFDVQADFGAWAYRIATNLALSYLRSRPKEAERVQKNRTETRSILACSRKRENRSGARSPDCPRGCSWWRPWR